MRARKNLRIQFWLVLKLTAVVSVASKVIPLYKISHPVKLCINFCNYSLPLAHEYTTHVAVIAVTYQLQRV